MRLKKRSHKVIVSLLLSTSLYAKSPQFKHKYLSRFEAIAVREMKRSGVPASITLAQGILESGWGKSPLAKASKNHFGIKCHSDWQGEKYHTSKENNEDLSADVNSVCYRSYAIAEESYKDHTDFLLQNPKYRPLFTSTNYKDWAIGLEACGYANDNSYAEALCELIEDNKLYRLDIEITSEYSAEELMAMPTPELMQYLRFEIFNTSSTADTLEMPIVDADWTALNKTEKKWFNMGLQPITFDSNRRRKTEKQNIDWDILF